MDKLVRPLTMVFHLLRSSYTTSSRYILVLTSDVLAVPPVDKDQTPCILDQSTPHASKRDSSINSHRNAIIPMSTIVRQKKVDINCKTKEHSLKSLDSGLSGTASVNKCIADICLGMYGHN